MGRLQDLVAEKRGEILAATHRNRGRSISLFGSVARGEESPSSDLDFLVSFEPGSSLFDLIHLRDELQEILGVDVDVVSEGGLRGVDDPIRRDLVAP